MLATRVLRLRQAPVHHRNASPLCLSAALQQSRRYKSRFAYPAGQAAYEDDYTVTPKYPPIDPETVRYSEARRQRLLGVQKWHKGMLEKETLEEKLMELNIQRRYGWFVALLSDQDHSYDSWEFIKYVTRTHLMEPIQVRVVGTGKSGADAEPKFVDQHLPPLYYSRELNEKVAHFKSKLQSSLHDIVKFELDGIERPHDEDEEPANIERRRTSSIVNQIFRFLVQELSTEVDYLHNAQVDRNPKMEAFWIMGGFARTELQKKALRNLVGVKKVFCEVKEDDPIERNIQYDGTNIVQLRTEFPFAPFLDQDAKFGSESPACRFPYDFRSYGYHSNVRYATQNAGHWSGCQSRSNVLSIHSTHHLHGRGHALEHEARTQDAAWIARAPQLLNAQAALVSFAKLVAQANVLGFNQWCDVPYPLATQTILTNGDDWSFYTYQLNTFKFDGRSIANGKNKRTNVCWGTGRLKLLREDGALNPDVVEHLLKFYLAPTLMDSTARFETPHIKRNLNDLEDEARRNFIFYNFQTMVSQRNYDDDRKVLPEIYQWEKFYKVDHQTRPVDARRRFFEIPTEMAPPPYKEPYRLVNPNLIKSKRLAFMLNELKEKKEAEKAKESIEARREKFRNMNAEVAEVKVGAVAEGSDSGGGSGSDEDKSK